MMRFSLLHLLIFTAFIAAFAFGVGVVYQMLPSMDAATLADRVLVIGCLAIIGAWGVIAPLILAVLALAYVWSGAGRVADWFSGGE